MRRKLAGWKANSLSFAGRVTLAQASLSSIPGYILQATHIPISVCKAAEKICRDFIWGTTADKRKCHLVGWDKICRAKSEGGLGFCSLRILNDTNIMKLAWGIMAHPTKLWVQIKKTKYHCGAHAILEVKA